jgi:hypothetical protein
MATVSELREHVVETLWSQWHELGIAAVVPRRHQNDVIDPEALIAFTATHSDLDPRLRDESIDWVIRYGSFVSKARLKNVLADWGSLDSSLFREYAATVNAKAGLGWPAGRARPLAFRSRARSYLEDLARPALLALRIRAVFGIGARAELMRVLVSRPQAAMTAAELSAETSYRKRNVLNELEPLKFAGVVRSFRAVNADRFSLAKADQLAGLVGPVPQRATRWTHTFRALGLLLDLARRATRRSDLQNAVDALRLLDENREIFVAAGMYPPPLPAGEAAWKAFLEWSVGQARSVSGL